MKRKSPVMLILSIVAGILILCCGGIFFGGYYLFKKGSNFMSCILNFQTVQFAVLDYAKDHKGKLPNAKTWQDDVASYYTDEVRKEGMSHQKIFKTLDPQGAWGCDQNGATPTGIAFNSDLSGKNLSDIKDPSTTALVFEVPAASRNASEPYKLQTADRPRTLGKAIPWIVYYAERTRSNLSDNGIDVKTGSSNDDDSDSDSDQSETPKTPETPTPPTKKAGKPNPDVPGSGG